jgi:hypothetical protein
MKSIFKAICVFPLILFVGCNNNRNQSNGTKVVSSKEDTQIIKGIGSNDKPDNVGKKLTHAQLYSEGEARREISTKLGADPSTMKKFCTERVNDDSLSIALYYQNNRIIVVVFRITNKKNEKIVNDVFYFDEKNNCISNSTWNKKELMEYTNAMYWDSLIRFDVNYNKIELNSSQKRQIIQSAKASLDSIMQHFPEFEYSFNWK